MIEADTPNLWELRRHLGQPATVAILVKAFIHAAKLVNLDKNLTEEQIGESANDILENKGYLKVEEIKFLLKRAMRTQNVYGRLDYNVLMNWIEQYDAERTEEAMRISDQLASQEINGSKENPEAVTFREYMAALEERARTDKDAAKRLKEINELPAVTGAPVSREDRERKRHEFQMWKQFNYLLKKDK